MGKGVVWRPKQENRPLSKGENGKDSSSKLGTESLSKMRKGVVWIPKQGNRLLSKEENDKDSSSKQGNQTLYEMGNGVVWSPKQESRPLSKEENGKDSSSQQGNQPLCEMGKGVVWSPKQENRPVSKEENAKDSTSKQGNQPLCKKGKGKAPSSKLGNRPLSKKGKVKTMLHSTVGKGKSKGYPTSLSPWDELSLMSPIERAMILESLGDDSPWDGFCSLDPIKRALMLESLYDDSPFDDFCSLDPIERALMRELFDEDSEFSSVGGHSSPDSVCKEWEREFDRNFEREIEKSIANKSENGLDLLDVEIFKSMLGKPSWIDSDDFKQRFPQVGEGMQGDVDEGLRHEMLRLLTINTGLQDIQSSKIHSNLNKGYSKAKTKTDQGSNKGYSKAKTKTQVQRLDPMDEAKATMELGKRLGVDFLGQEDFFSNKFAEKIIKERAEYDALR